MADDQPPPSEEQVLSIKAEMNAAIESVSKIVNQPITHLKRDPSQHPSEYSPGWFHKGAIRPNFSTVDVRQTQELTYAKNAYVTSDVNPREMFIGSELEFNRMTKFFYTDHNLPKKKLTQEEMLEINRLYRIIGADEAKLVAMKMAAMPPVRDENFFASPQGAMCVFIALVLGAYFYFTNRPTV